MFVGHYGVSYLAKAVEPRLRLWVLFLAVQLVDIGWAVLVLLGIEKVRIVPGITATNPLDLYYMPYTHSLVASVVWAGAALLLYRFWRKAAGWRPAIIVGLAVLSHWIFDWLVHRPDLPLYDDAMKVGLGLWDRPALALALEGGLLLGGILLYLRSSVAIAPAGRYAMIAFAAVMLIAQVAVFFGPPPPGPAAAALTALAAYIIFAAIVAWLESFRRHRPSAGSESAGERAARL